MRRWSPLKVRRPSPVVFFFFLARVNNERITFWLFFATAQLQLPAPPPASPPAPCAQAATCQPRFHTTPLSSTTPTVSKATPVRSLRARSASSPCRKAAPPRWAPLASARPPPPPPPTSPGPETQGLLRCRMSWPSRPPPTSTPDRRAAPAPEGTQTSSRCGRAH